jgi:catechol 2,3-dioxygenase-like lactoylglutathione lyase family enzyme
MSTIDHVTIRVVDLAAARAFYRCVFNLLDFTGHRHEAEPFLECGVF